jgi:uncharacterized glyoxalase superfamily protein PhnB
MRPVREPKLAPYLVVKDPQGLVRFLELALDGKLAFEHRGTDGQLHHAEVQIADSLVMIGRAPSDQEQFPAMLHVYVPDADAAYERAMKAGATSVRPPTIEQDGDKRGGVQDAWGNQWWFATYPKL